MRISSRPSGKSILTIQSAVMYGAVGNDAAMAIYDHFGISAFRLDTVRLAAHPGFGQMYAAISATETLDRLLENFSRLDIATSLAIIQTGYLGHADQVPILARHITQMKADNPALEYCLDPVMGDGGKLYVDKALSTALRAELLPLAQHLTPNLFELEMLADRPINTMQEVIDAATTLKSMYQLSSIIVTAIPEDEMMTDLIISEDGLATHSHKRQRSGVSGGGDMFTAYYLSKRLLGHSAHHASRLASKAVTVCAGLSDDPRALPIKDWLQHHKQPSSAE